MYEKNYFHKAKNKDGYCFWIRCIIYNKRNLLLYDNVLLFKLTNRPIVVKSISVTLNRVNEEYYEIIAYRLKNPKKIILIPVFLDSQSYFS